MEVMSHNNCAVSQPAAYRTALALCLPCVGKEVTFKNWFNGCLSRNVTAHSHSHSHTHWGGSHSGVGEPRPKTSWRECTIVNLHLATVCVCVESFDVCGRLVCRTTLERPSTTIDAPVEVLTFITCCVYASGCCLSVIVGALDRRSAMTGMKQQHAGYRSSLKLQKQVAHLKELIEQEQQAAEDTRAKHMVRLVNSSRRVGCPLG